MDKTMDFLTGVHLFRMPFRQKSKDFDDIRASRDQAHLIIVEETAAHGVLDPGRRVSLPANRKHC